MTEATRLCRVASALFTVVLTACVECKCALCYFTSVVNLRPKRSVAIIVISLFSTVRLHRK